MILRKASQKVGQKKYISVKVSVVVYALLLLAIVIILMRICCKSTKEIKLRFTRLIAPENIDPRACARISEMGTICVQRRFVKVFGEIKEWWVIMVIENQEESNKAFTSG